MNPIDLMGVSQSAGDEICQAAKRAKLQRDLHQHERQKRAHGLIADSLHEHQKKLEARSMLLKFENHVLSNKLKEECLNADEEKLSLLKSSYIEKLSKVEDMYSNLQAASIAIVVTETEAMKNHEIELAKAKNLREKLIKELEQADGALSLINQEMLQLPKFEAAVMKLKEEETAKLSELEANTKEIERVKMEINNIGDDFLEENRELSLLLQELESQSSHAKALEEEEIATLEKSVIELQAKFEHEQAAANLEAVKLQALETDLEKLNKEFNLKVMELCNQHDIPEEWQQNIPDDCVIKTEKLLQAIEDINKAADAELDELREKQRRVDDDNEQVQFTLKEISEQLAQIEEEKKQCALKITQNHLLSVDTNETKNLIKQGEDELHALRNELIAVRREAQEKRVKMQSDIFALKTDVDKLQQDIIEEEVAFGEKKASIEGETAMIESKNKRLLRNIEEAKKIRAAYKEKYLQLTKNNQPKSPIKKVTFNSVVDERSITDESAQQY